MTPTDDNINITKITVEMNQTRIDECIYKVTLTGTEEDNNDFKFEAYIKDSQYYFRDTPDNQETATNASPLEWVKNPDEFRFMLDDRVKLVVYNEDTEGVTSSSFTGKQTVLSVIDNLVCSNRLGCVIDENTSIQYTGEPVAMNDLGQLLLQPSTTHTRSGATAGYTKD
ncbi:MAG: hypothetical protein KDD76_01500 [Rickettsiales bacterium]|nr:hypothetical protein [Rickettsiales bacterium]